MDYQGEGEGDVGKEMAWLVQRKADMSGQAKQELGKALGMKDGREFGRKIHVSQKVGT